MVTTGIIIIIIIIIVIIIIIIIIIIVVFFEPNVLVFQELTTDLLNPFLQKVWPLPFVNQRKLKNSGRLLRHWGRTKLKMSIFSLYLPHNLQSRILVFQKFMHWG